MFFNLFHQQHPARMSSSSRLSTMTRQACLFSAISIPTCYIAHYDQRSRPTTLLYSSYYIYMHVHVAYSIPNFMKLHVTCMYMYVCFLNMWPTWNCVLLPLCFVKHATCMYTRNPILLHLCALLFEHVATRNCAPVHVFRVSRCLSLECSVHIHSAHLDMSANKEGEFLLTRATILPLAVVARLPTIVELGLCLWPGQVRPGWPSLVPGVSYCDCGRQR